MDVTDNASTVNEERRGPVCVLAHSIDDEQALAAAHNWGLALPEDPSRSRRPRVRFTANNEIDLTLLVLDQDRDQVPVRMIAGDQGLLVLSTDDGLAVVRPAVETAGSIWAGVVAIAVAVARRCEEILEQLDDEGQQIEDRATGYTSSPQRRTMGRLRARLFQIQEVQAAQRDLLAPFEEVSESVGPEHQRLLKRAAAAFEANRSLASRLYAMLGDLLNEQDTVVSERLTLVATIFLPLTLATGFFGMNFPWLLDHIGGLGSFITLGLVLPALATVLTLMVIRRLTRTS